MNRRDLLDLVVQGQSERSILERSKKTYLSKVKVMMRLLNECDDIRSDCLIMDDNNKPMQHSGIASGIFKMKLPISCETAQLLFAMISIDDTLPKQSVHRRREVNEGARADDTDEINEIDLMDPGKDKLTVTPQTYQNYKSALKWWHRFSSASCDKVGVAWPEDVDAALNKSIASYKRDVGVKKRKGIMMQREGKRPYNLFGYITLCKHFNMMGPNGKRHSWNEGLFAGLFTKLSVNTIGRSDNIDDLLLRNIDWQNDAMTLCFGTTKPDQSGERTSDIKRIFANPFKPELCVILSLAIYTWCKCRTSEEACVHLFDGDVQNKRYYAILMEALKDIPEELDLGCNRDDIGTHSNRKFAESTSVSKIDGPSRTEVCLRAGQGVGKTQDCYMFSEQDGDALVRGTIAQLYLMQMKLM